jgi:hypothetical protein
VKRKERGGFMQTGQNVSTSRDEVTENMGKIDYFDDNRGRIQKCEESWLL